jgi:hypothetical protein
LTAGEGNFDRGYFRLLGQLLPDDGGEANLRYTWTSGGPAPVTFSANGSNAAKNVTATFSKAGAADTPLPIDQLIAWLRTCVEHGRYLPELSPDRDALQGLVDYWTTRLLRLGQALPDDVDRLADFEPTAGIPLAIECPYPGLDPYTDRHRSAFFGREELVASYIAHLEDPRKRILLVVGASGSGKSSLVLAGVLPRLEERHRDKWLFAPRLTPGEHPVAALAAAVAQAIGDPSLAPEIEARSPRSRTMRRPRWRNGATASRSVGRRPVRRIVHAVPRRE